MSSMAHRSAAMLCAFRDKDYIKYSARTLDKSKHKKPTMSRNENALTPGHRWF